MHFRMAVTCTPVLALVGGLPHPGWGVVPMTALTALIKRLQLWFANSRDTSRAGLVSMSAIPLLGEMAANQRCELNPRSTVPHSAHWRSEGTLREGRWKPWYPRRLQ